MKDNIKIKKAREQLHLSQEDLADKVGVSVQTISKWERGVSEPSVQNRLMLKEVLGIEFYPRTQKSKRMISIKFLFMLGCIVLIGLFGLMSLMRDDEWMDITDKIGIEKNLIHQKLVFNSIAYKIEDEKVVFKIDADFNENLCVTAFYPPNSIIKEEFFYADTVIYFELNRIDLLNDNSKHDSITMSLTSFKGDDEKGYQVFDKLYLFFKKELMREIYEGS